MKECLACLGDGHHDMRDLDACVAEHLNDRALAHLKRHCPNFGQIVPCSVCDGTGLIDDEDYADLLAVARASIEQAVARIRELELRGANRA